MLRTATDMPSEESAIQVWEDHMKKILLAAALLLFVMTSAVCANPIENIVIDGDTQIVTVSGDFGSAAAGKRIVCKILRPNVTLDDMAAASPDNLYEKLCGIYDAVTDSDGKYSISFKMASVTGVYTVAAGGNNDTEKYTKTFEYFSPDDVFLVLNNLELARKNNDAAKIKSILDDELNRKQLGINDVSYDKVGYADYADALAGLLSVQSKAFDSVNSFKNIYAKCCVVHAFNINDSADNINKLILLCDDILNITDSDEYRLYGKFDSDSKQYVDGKMFNAVFENPDEINTFFRQQVLLRNICIMDSWSLFNSFITKYADVLGVDLTAYNKLSVSGRNAADKELTAKEFGTAEDFVLKFNNAVKNSQGSTKSDTSGSGGGKKNSGSVSSGSFPMQSVLPAENKNTFDDIKSVPWAEEAITALADKGILDGKGNGSFAPMDNVTREEAIKILVIALGLKTEPVNTESLFNDVAPSDWSAKYIMTARQAGLAEGMDNGMFMPRSNITRQDFAILVYRAAGLSGINMPAVNEQAEFADSADISPYAAEAVNAMHRAGLINGAGNGMFMPNARCTRAEAAKIIYEFLKLTE